MNQPVPSLPPAALVGRTCTLTWVFPKHPDTEVASSARPECKRKGPHKHTWVPSSALLLHREAAWCNSYLGP